MAVALRRRTAFAAALVLCLAATPAGAQAGAPEPRYKRTVADAVTTDNPLTAFTHPAGGCPAERPCPLPDPNPADDPAVVVDNYTADAYERPTAGPGAAVVASVDIVSARVGSDGEHHYYRIDLSATDEAGTLPHAYGFELDYDDGDAAGDTMVTVDGAALGTAFAATGVVALWNRASTISGPTPGLPDEPGATPPGFELRAFDGGRNLLTDAPGGADAVVARIAPDRPASIELAVRRSFLAAINEGVAVTKVAFRPDAALARLPPASYAVHDRLRRAEAGSPYPFLVKPGAPDACPTTERRLPPAQRIALDSGTGVDTARPNPCYPVRSLTGYDNMPFVVFDPRSPAGSDADQLPDLAVSATHRGDLERGRDARLTLAVRNVGTAATRGPVVLTDRLPSGVRARSAAGPGWACSVAGSTVSCATRRPLAPGATSAVAVSVAVDGTADEVRNHVDAVTPGDPQTSNNAVVDLARVVRPASFPVVPALAAAAVAVALATLGVAARRRRHPASLVALNSPGTPPPSP